MFQTQNRENYKKYLKSCCVLQDHYDDERDKIVFHNTTPDLQDQDQDRFLVPVLSTDHITDIPEGFSTK